jgi:hypothetical protein
MPWTQTAPLSFAELFGVGGEAFVRDDRDVVIDDQTFHIRVERRGATVAIVDVDAERELLALDGYVDLASTASGQGLRPRPDARVARAGLLVVTADRVESIPLPWLSEDSIGWADAALAWAGGRFVAVRFAGSVRDGAPATAPGDAGAWQSSDGRDWTFIGRLDGPPEWVSTSHELLDGTALGLAAPLVLVLDLPEIGSGLYGSDDGRTWRRLSAAPGAVFALERGLISTGPSFSDDNYMYASTDGVTWDRLDSTRGILGPPPFGGDASPYRAGPGTIVVLTEPGPTWRTTLLRFAADE